jgi:hypothetical protein
MSLLVIFDVHLILEYLRKVELLVPKVPGEVEIGGVKVPKFGERLDSRKMYFGKNRNGHQGVQLKRAEDFVIYPVTGGSVYSRCRGLK